MKKTHSHSSRYYNDIALRLAHRFFNVKHLHYGYFEPGGLPQDLEHLPEAQEAYMRKLLAEIPAGVRTILDVGCGTGAVARELIEKGYEVTALAPDPYLIEQANKNTGGRARTFVAMYENMEDEIPAGSIDLVLMSESCQYVQMETGFAQHRRYLKPGGYLLVADFFKILPPDDRSPSRSGHRLEQFLSIAEQNGFKKVREEDITARVAPTMDIYQGMINERIFPLAEAGIEFFSRLSPFFFRIARFFLEKKVRKLQDKYSRQGAEVFQRYKRYEILLFQRA